MSAHDTREGYKNEIVEWRDWATHIMALSESPDETGPYTDRMPTIHFH